MDFLTHEFSRRIVFAVRTSGCLSLIGSFVILYAIVSDRKKKLQRIQYRLLAGVCVTDVVYSLANIVSTAAIPRDTPDIYHIYGNIGTTATCKTQGFVFQWGLVGVPFYMASLSLYYLLATRYKMKDQDIARKVEPYMHAISILIPLAFAIAALCLDLYHNKLFGCWIEGVPWGCALNYDIVCVEAANARKYQLGFAGAWLLLVSLFQICAMCLIYCTVRQQEKLMESVSFQRNGNEKSSFPSVTRASSETRETAIQAFLYILAFLLTYLWPLVHYVVLSIGGHQEGTFILLMSFFVPLFGFWNFIAYIRPRYMRISKLNKEKSFFWKLKSSIVTPTLFESHIRHEGSTSLRPPRRTTEDCRKDISQDDSDSVVEHMISHVIISNKISLHMLESFDRISTTKGEDLSREKILCDNSGNTNDSYSGLKTETLSILSPMSVREKLSPTLTTNVSCLKDHTDESFSHGLHAPVYDTSYKYRCDVSLDLSLSGSE